MTPKEMNKEEQAAKNPSQSALNERLPPQNGYPTPEELDMLGRDDTKVGNGCSSLKYMIFEHIFTFSYPVREIFGASCAKFVSHWGAKRKNVLKDHIFEVRALGK